MSRSLIICPKERLTTSIEKPRAQKWAVAAAVTAAVAGAVAVVWIFTGLHYCCFSRPPCQVPYPFLVPFPSLCATCKTYIYLIPISSLYHRVQPQAWLSILTHWMRSSSIITTPLHLALHSRKCALKQMIYKYAFYAFHAVFLGHFKFNIFEHISNK